MADNKTRYSDKELEEFKSIILKKIEKAEKDLELIKSAYTNDWNFELWPRQCFCVC